jgi:hypothetical protein
VTHGGAAVSSAQTWTVGGRAHNVHSTGQGIEPLQLMINAKGLPTAQFLPAARADQIPRYTRRRPGNSTGFDRRGD